MKGPVIFVPFTNVNVGSEDIKSSDKGTWAEGTFASYHPCPKEVLQRFIKPWKRRGWDSHCDSTSLKTILEKTTGSRLSLSFTPIKRTWAVAAGRTPSLPSLGETYGGGKRAWWADKGWSLLHSRLPLRIFKVWGNPMVQTNFPHKFHPHGTVWKVKLFGFGEDCLFGKRWFSFETLFYPFINRLVF